MAKNPNGHGPEIPPAVRPDNRDVPASQQFVDGIFQWYQALVAINNAVAGQPLAHGRRLRLLSVWPQDEGKLFTASIRARDRGKSDREWVLYTTSGTPANALSGVVRAALDENTAWKEQVRKSPQGAAESGGGLPEIL